MNPFRPVPDCFGPYEVVALLGAGGMGEVYRARDPRLNRHVAIKVLARAGGDPARQRHLLDEAQAASALNHPNIITVYDVGTRDGTPFIVSELVEGASLREMLDRAPLTVREVLELGAQMAEGLAAAHQAGIVHRDFKPENVMVTPEGRVKILDFGLALVGTRDGAPCAEAEKTLTVAGTIVGTVPYMSPEQARGAVVDFRTDQFSLGLTLYEMVAGRRAYSAETSAQIIAAIIEDEPEPIAKLNPRVPAPLRWLIERCLTKDPRQRYESTTDLARDLRTLRDRQSEFASSIDVPAAPPRRRGRGLLTAAALASAVAAGVLAGLTGAKEPGADLDRYRFTPIATDAGYQAAPAWSPDGKTLAYVAGVNGVLQVFTKVPGLAPRAQVTHEGFDCRDPFWSPDGTRLYYISLVRDREGLKSISTAGGESESVVEDVYRAALSPDGKTLAFFRNQGRVMLYLASPPGSAPAPYTRSPFGGDRGDVDATLHFSPDSSKLGVWVERGQATSDLLRAEFWVIPMGGSAPYRAAVPGEVPVGLAPAFSWLPDNRRIVTALPNPAPGVHVWLMDTERADTRLLTATGEREDEPAVSPDGKRLALTLQDADYDLYELSVEHPTPSPVLTTSRNEMDPARSASGTAMAFTTDRSGHGEIWVRSRDGVESPLVTPDDFRASRTYLLSAPALSPDGQRIAFNRGSPEGYQIWIKSIGGGPPIPLAQNDRAQDWPSWSADGEWIAFAQAAAAGAGPSWSLMKAQVGGRKPPEELVKDIAPFSPIQWAPGGAWIAFNSSDGLSIVAPDGKTPRLLSEREWMAFAWSEDEQRLYGIRLSDDFQHLTFTSVDIRSGAERVLARDFMPLPVAGRLVRGMTRTAPATFLASIVHVRSDVWLLEGFLRPETLWDRLASSVSVRGR